MSKSLLKHHQHGRQPKTFTLLKQHADGTVDFGLEDGTVVVERCPVGPQADPSRSYVVLIEEDEEADPNAEARKVAKSLRSKATKFAKAAVEARKAADAVQGRPSEADFAKVAEEAEAAARDADSAADAAEAVLK